MIQYDMVPDRLLPDLDRGRSRPAERGLRRQAEKKPGSCVSVMYMYVCIYVCMYVCIYIYIYIMISYSIV